MINRRVTRMILGSTEVTSLLAQPNASDFLPVITTSSTFYIGFHGKFAARYFQVGALNTQSATVLVHYWNGSAWADVDDLVDQTAVMGVPFAKSGFISWVNKDDWALRTLPGIDIDVPLYWVKLTWNANLDAATGLKAVLNVFNDDDLLRAYFPELISDANYLPSGKSNFLDQYLAAKDYVVMRLKQRKKIQDEAQIIDLNQVAVAATYRSAVQILQGIATSEDAQELLAIAQKGFDDEMNEIDFAVDTNEDGVIDDNERVQVSSVWISRR